MTRVEFNDYYKYCNKVKASIKENHGVNVIIIPFPTSRERLTLEELSNIALEVYNEEPHRNSVTDIKEMSRKAELVSIRHIFCYFATMLGYRRTEVGDFLNRDHSTVVHGLRYCSNMIDTNDIVYGSIIRKVTKKIDKYVENISDNFKAEVNTEPSDASLFNEK